MVLPIAVAAGRAMITNASKNVVRKAGVINKARRRNVRKVHRGYARKLIHERKLSQLNEASLANHPLNIPQINTKSKTTIKNRARTLTASLTITILVLPFDFVIFFFGLISLIGYGIESGDSDFLWGLLSTVVSTAVPGDAIFVAGYVITATLGILTMFAAAGIYQGYRIDCFSGHKGIYFLCCCGAYLAPVPFVSMIPWLGIWMLTVIYSQKKA